MDRRRFLQLLGLAPVAASTKAYSFLGNILRPKQLSDEEIRAKLLKYQMQQIEKLVNPPIVSRRNIYYVNYSTYQMVEAQTFKEWLTR